MAGRFFEEPFILAACRLLAFEATSKEQQRVLQELRSENALLRPIEREIQAV